MFFQRAAEKVSARRDIYVLGAFVGAITVLLLVAFYIIARLAGERAYRAKWKDYMDCGIG